MKKYFSSILFIAIVLLSLIPFFKPGLFNVHDPTSIIRIWSLKLTLLDGQIPAAWSNYLNQGYGYPLFLYYAPVFSYLGAIFSLVSPSYLIALKLTLIFLTLFGAWGMFKLSGYLAAIAYTFLPYHASSLYVRGSYAEFTTIVLLPWLLYYWQQPLKRHNFFITTFLTCLFFLSHNSLPFLFLPMLLIWIAYYQKASYKIAFLSLLSSIFLGSWYFYPVFWERNLVQIDQIAKLTKLEDHALNISQLWHSPWGYGGSSRAVDGMSFMLGKFQLVLAFITFFYVLLGQKFKFPTIFFIFIFVIYSFASLDLSLPLWGIFPSLAIVQFPWRTLAFASFALSALIQIPSQISKSYKIPFLFLTILGLVYFNLKFFTPELSVVTNDATLLSQEKLDTVAKDKIPEYLPLYMPQFPTTAAEVSTLTKTATRIYGSFSQLESGALRVPIAYMPQWELAVNGQIYEINPSSLGLIETVVSFAPATYEINLSWRRTLGEQLSILITLLTLFFMIGYSRGYIFK